MFNIYDLGGTRISRISWALPTSKTWSTALFCAFAKPCWVVWCFIPICGDLGDSRPALWTSLFRGRYGKEDLWTDGVFIFAAEKTSASGWSDVFVLAGVYDEILYEFRRYFIFRRCRCTEAPWRPEIIKCVVIPKRWQCLLKYRRGILCSCHVGLCLLSGNRMPLNDLWHHLRDRWKPHCQRHTGTNGLSARDSLDRYRQETDTALKS